MHGNTVLIYRYLTNVTTVIPVPAGAVMEFFLFATASRPAVGPTQSPIQGVLGAVSTAVKRPGREANHSPLSNAEVKNA
jgi:hypothetical protein